LTEDKFKNSLVDITVLIQEKDNFVKAKQQSLQSNKELIIERRELANLIGLKESEMIVDMNLFEEQDLVQR
jgi:outer membrane protein TolC